MLPHGEQAVACALPENIGGLPRAFSEQMGVAQY